MRTESTFSFGAFIELDIEPDEVDPVAVDPAVEPVAVDPVDPPIRDEDDELSSVPVISTLWPTCALSLESSASSR